MMMREVVEGLKCVAGVRMEGDAIITRAEEVLEGVDSGFVMLCAGIVAV